MTHNTLAHFIVTIIIVIIIIIIVIIRIIAFKGTIQDFLQSPHCTVNRRQHVHSSGPGTIICKSHEHIERLSCATCCVTCHVVRRNSSVENIWHRRQREIYMEWRESPAINSNSNHFSILFCLQTEIYFWWLEGGGGGGGGSNASCDQAMAQLAEVIATIAEYDKLSLDWAGFVTFRFCT